MDHPKRSFLKSLSWRVIAFAVTVIAVYIYSKDVKESLVVGISANAVKILLYYLHERIWNKIKFGVLKGPEYHI